MESNAKQNGEQDGKQKRQKWKPPRGIRYFEDFSRPTPYYLQWRVPDTTKAEGSRKETEAFKTEKDREISAKALAEKRQAHGSVIMEFDPVKWRRYLEFQKIVGADVDPILVAHEWKAARQGVGTAGATSLTVKEAWIKYRALRVAESDDEGGSDEERRHERKLDADTIRHIDKHVGERFVGSFGSMRLNEVTAEIIREWMRGLKHPKTGKPLEAVTMNHHRKDVNGLFERARKEGWIMRNPCELVIPFDTSTGDEDEDEIGDPMPVRQVFEFFKANRDNPEIARVALEAFGALRYKTAGKIKFENINFEDRGIEMPGRKHKSRRRKFRHGHQDQLWEWLAHANEETHPVWKLTLRQYAESKREALANAKLRPFIARTDEERAKVKELRNIWRRSCISYLIAKTRNIPLVAYLAQHRRTTTTEGYEGRATHRDAVLYCAITPESVLLTWEQFEAKFGLKAGGEIAVVAA